jgi:hypothetical protein
MLTAVGALLSAFRIKTRPKRGGASPLTLKTVFAGLHFIWREKLILGAISLDLFAVLLGGAVASAAGLCARDSAHGTVGAWDYCGRLREWARL